MMRGVVAVLFMAAATPAMGSAASVTPIQKVIGMLTDMLAKAKSEKQQEAEAFKKYEEFIQLTTEEKIHSIKKEKELIEQLKADIDKAEADAMVAAKEIAAHDSDIAQWESDKAAATKQREEANAVFQETHKDYTESIDAVERALATLKAGNKPAGEAVASLLQLYSLNKLSAKAQNMIKSYLQDNAKGQPVVQNALLQDAAMAEDGTAFDDSIPQAKVAAYESSSGGVMEMVEQLGEKFDNERMELEKREANEAAAYEMMAKDLTGQIDAATDERNQKTAHKAKREGDKADAEGSLSDTEDLLAADTKFMKDMEVEKTQKTSDFGIRQEVRAGEIEALTKAMEIMAGDSVAGSGGKHLPGLIQKSKKVSLVQLRASATSATPDQREAVAFFLEDKARSLKGSKVLELVAQKVAVDPFKKIVKMIQDMIAKLEEEASEEAEQKGFCDTEMSTNKQTRDTKTEESGMLKAQSEELSASIMKLGEEIAQLVTDIAEIDAAVKTATEDRFEEKDKNTATIADAKAGALAVAAATKVLQDFYAKAAMTSEGTIVEPTPAPKGIKWDPRIANMVLLQTDSSKNQVPGAPETFDTPFKGGDAGGILAMLEVCQSDFERLDAETSAAEVAAAKEYDEFMSDSKDDKETKDSSRKSKVTKKIDEEGALARTKKDLKGVSEELAAAETYYEKLKPQCIDPGESYEERVARRKAEIEGLKEALKILNGESV
jgi:hypothetical protein